MIRFPLIVLFTLLLSLTLMGQEKDSLLLDISDSLYLESTLDTLAQPTDKTTIENPSAIKKFLGKLSELDSLKNRQINIVHIGDSHIQADLLTDQVRSHFQQRFGNSGIGFTFPYPLAKTNGSAKVRFTSNVNWDSQRNIYPNIGKPIGLSGIALSTTQKDFYLNLKVRSEQDALTKLKVIHPKTDSLYQLAQPTQGLPKISTVTQPVYHVIKSSETLSGIAKKYHTTVSNLQKLNQLKTTQIRDGKKLLVKQEQVQKSTPKLEYIPLDLTTKQSAFAQTFELANPVQEAYLVAKDSLQPLFAINGLVLTNDSPGILYHSIGVNGAKYSDYNKYDLFFEQLTELSPDLVIVSLGTNETFDKQEASTYMSSVEEFLSKLKTHNPNTEVLLTTVPPSLFNRKNINPYCKTYSKALKNNAEALGYAVWDLFEILGGESGMRHLINSGKITKDRVHYTLKGYQDQGDLLYQSLLNVYQEYKNQN